MEKGVFTFSFEHLQLLDAMIPGLDPRLMFPSYLYFFVVLVICSSFRFPSGIDSCAPLQAAYLRHVISSFKRDIRFIFPCGAARSLDGV